MDPRISQQAEAHVHRAEIRAHSSVMAPLGNNQLIPLLFYTAVQLSIVFSTHFRGGIIMIRPQPGGSDSEVVWYLINIVALMHAPRPSVQLARLYNYTAILL